MYIQRTRAAFEGEAGGKKEQWTQLNLVSLFGEEKKNELLVLTLCHNPRQTETPQLDILTVKNGHLFVQEGIINKDMVLMNTY